MVYGLHFVRLINRLQAIRMTYRNKFYIIIFLSLLIVCCKQKTSANENNILSTNVDTTKTNKISDTEINPELKASKTNVDVNKTEKTKKIDINSDTITVSGKHIVFFTISQKEYDSYEHNANSGIDEVLSDFDYHSNSAADSLKKYGFELTMTASRFIKLKMDNGTVKIFDRIENTDHIVGRIYSNGKKTFTSYGIATDNDIIKEASEFLKQNSL